MSFPAFPNAYPTNSPADEPSAATKATAMGFIINAQLAAISKLGAGRNTVALDRQQSINKPI